MTVTYDDYYRAKRRRLLRRRSAFFCRCCLRLGRRHLITHHVFRWDRPLVLVCICERCHQQIHRRDKANRRVPLWADTAAYFALRWGYYALVVSTAVITWAAWMAYK